MEGSVDVADIIYEIFIVIFPVLLGCNMTSNFVWGQPWIQRSAGTRYISLCGCRSRPHLDWGGMCRQWTCVSLNPRQVLVPTAKWGRQFKNTCFARCSPPMGSFQHECPLCAGPHASISCPKPRGRQPAETEKAGSPRALGGGGSGALGEKAQSRHYSMWYLWPEDGEYLWLGFTEGFHIPFQGEQCPYWVLNLQSIKGMEEVVRQNI